MAGDATSAALKQVVALFRDGATAGLTDGQLLGRFADREGPEAEAAFAALVDRHGAMVLRVCRQVLGDGHEAQDASQATFLVLARRARSIARRDSVGSWLHGVALRVAAKSRVAASRRRARERRAGETAAVRVVGPSEAREGWPELHEELARLPESSRAPLVLCYFEGLTQEQAAARLGLPLGTVQSRLARGRAKLKSRLARRGFASTAGLSVAAPSAAPPVAWATATVRASTRFATKSGASTLGASPTADALAREVIRAMTLLKLKLALGLGLALSAVAASGVTWARQGKAPDAAEGQAAAKTKAAPSPASAKPADPPIEGQPEFDLWRQKAEIELTILQAKVEAKQAEIKQVGAEFRARRLASNLALLARLDKPITLHFPRETPLEDVLKAIRTATSSGPGDGGVPIYVDPVGLKQANKTIQSTVTIDIEGILAETALRLVLKQLGLAYQIKDGLVTISAELFGQGGLQ